MPTDKKIIVYTANGCEYCDDVKKFLQEHNIPYEEYDLLDDKNKDKIGDIIDTEGIVAIPVVKIGNEKIRGFNKDEMLCKLDIDKKKCTTITPSD